jgi:hypothetical protein
MYGIIDTASLSYIRAITHYAILAEFGVFVFS